jgi:hypothetical protein
VTRLIATLAVSALLLLWAAPAGAMCTKDSDCKGGEICDMGSCVAPAPIVPSDPATKQTTSSGAGYTRPAAAPAGGAGAVGAGASFSWHRYYGEQALILAFPGWGGMTPEGGREVELKPDFMAGMRLAGYGVLTRLIHLGGYFSFASGEFRVPNGFSFFNLGFSMKVGGRVGSRFWLGGVLDLGAAFWEPDYGETYFGFQVNPAFEFNVMVLAVNKFRLGFFSQLGASFTPFATTEFFNRTYTAWMANISLLLGVTLGAGS